MGPLMEWTRTLTVFLASAALVVAEAQQAPVRLAKPGQQERFERLSDLGDCVVEWHCRIADVSNAKKADLRAAVRGLAVKSARQHSWRDADFSLATFAGARGNPGRVLIEGRPWRRVPSSWQTAVAETLTKDQVAKIEAAIKARRSFHVRNLVEAHLAYIEEFVGLTKDERKSLRKRLADKYGSQLLLRPLCVENLRELHLLDDDVIRRTLGTRAERLSRSLFGRGQDVTTTVTARVEVRKKWSDDERESKVEAALAVARARVARLHNKRVQAIIDQYRLDEKSKRRLQLAAKGVRSRASKDWREQLEKNVRSAEENMGEPLGGLVTGAYTTSRRFSVPPLEEDKLWKKTLSAVLMGENVVPTTAPEFVRAGAVCQLLVAFDNELWLRPNQREPFRKRLAKVVNEFTARGTESNVSGLIALTTRRLGQDVNGILTDVQRRALDRLK